MARRNVRTVLNTLFLAAAMLALAGTSLVAAVAGESGNNDLVVADGGATKATVVVSPQAGDWEKRAAEDLVTFIEMMSGAKPVLANTAEAAATAMGGDDPVLVIGQAALQADASLQEALNKVAKQKPVLRADAIVLRRADNRVYLAGTNDDSHYYAVSDLLHRWGCRWYLPTDFGQVIPTDPTLKVGTLDYSYGPPFEVRKYWLAWVGDPTGQPEFTHRNYMNTEIVPSGHSLGEYVKDIVPPGKTAFNVPISEESTAQHVAKQVLPKFAKGENVMLGMDDGLYESDSPKDKELIALQYDKYFLTQSYTDAFMIFYNRVAELLMQQAPQSKAKIGFLIYSNITLPPVKDVVAKEPLVGYLAPIDFDPNHGMDDPRSAPRREYKDIMYKWAKVMQGRMVIYDYDQGMLVWRDIPNPSHMAFREDVKHYAKAGILGVDTESRGAMATIFTNLFLRSQLMWNPEADVDALLGEFYEKFYGPAAKPMAAYWGIVFKAWEDSLVTEHEYFVAPAIYTPELIETLRKHLADGQQAIASMAGNAGRNEKLYVDRMTFTQLGFEVLDNYTAMVRAAGSEVDFPTAVAAGERGLAAREKLTAMNGTFTTYKVIGENGYAWWPGEVQQYKELIPLVDGSKGTLLAKLPLEWAFRRDPKDVGVTEQWFNATPDLTKWKSLKQPASEKDRWSLGGDWEMVRSDLYLQSQGIVTEEYQSYTGHGWYHTPIELTAEQVAGPAHLKFPGLFNECWLYVNGQEVGHREFKGMWWLSDYRFEWDVDLTGKLKAGQNTIVVRINNPHHFGGMFRRPFLYKAK